MADSSSQVQASGCQVTRAMTTSTSVGILPAKNETEPIQSSNSKLEGPVQAQSLFKSLSLLDRILTPAILLSMILGVVIGVYAPNVQATLDTARFESVSIPIAIGLIFMMWPILTKIQYERLALLFKSKNIWTHLLLSIFLSWIIGPFLMLALAWATLPDQPTYRTGVILVGIARCIAMVMIWNQLAKGNAEYCAVLVVLNSVMQIILFSPFSLLFINLIGGEKQKEEMVSYGTVAISVLIYLGIPLAAGLATRYLVWHATSKQFLDTRFLPAFGPVAFLGLLYTIIVMFAYQGHHIIQNIGLVFRVFVPLALYFVIMWGSAFGFVYYLGSTSLHRGSKSTEQAAFGYEMAVVQAFTAGSNNFELAIAVAIATYGVGSDQALAATIGPLVEVPVLLALTWVSLWLKRRLTWTTPPNGTEKFESKIAEQLV